MTLPYDAAAGVKTLPISLSQSTLLVPHHITLFSLAFHGKVKRLNRTDSTPQDDEEPISL